MNDDSNKDMTGDSNNQNRSDNDSIRESMTLQLYQLIQVVQVTVLHLVWKIQVEL